MMHVLISFFIENVLSSTYSFFMNVHSMVDLHLFTGMTAKGFYNLIDVLEYINF